MWNICSHCHFFKFKTFRIKKTVNACISSIVCPEKTQTWPCDLNFTYIQRRSVVLYIVTVTLKASWPTRGSLQSLQFAYQPVQRTRKLGTVLPISSYQSSWDENRRGEIWLRRCSYNVFLFQHYLIKKEHFHFHFFKWYK